MMESASANLIEFIDMKKFIDPYNVIKEPKWFCVEDEEIQEFEQYYKKI